MIFKNFNKINSAIIFILFIVLFNCKSTHNNSKNNQNIREIVFTKLLKVDEMIFDDFLDTIKLDSAAIPTNNLKFDSVEDSINFYENPKGEFKKILKTKIQDTTKVIMKIYEDSFFLPEIVNNRALSIGKRIFKDSLVSSFSNEEKAIGNRFKKIHFFNENDYNFDYLINEKSNIFSFECFKIIANSKDGLKSKVMFVTNDIKLDYNPIINIESFIGKYYVLELKIYYKKELVESYQLNEIKYQY